MKGDEVKFPLGIKLVTIISVLVLLSLGTITVLVSHFVRDDTQITAEGSNHTINSQEATSAESELSTIRSNVFLLLDMINAAGYGGAMARQSQAFFYERNQNIAAIVIPGEIELINNRFFLANEIDVSLLTDYLATSPDLLERARNGEIFLENVAPNFGIPVIAMYYPWLESGKSQAVVILFSTENLTNAFGGTTSNKSISQTFMLNDKGDLLIHPDFELVKSGANMAEHPLFKEMQSRGDDNRQIIFKEAKKKYFGSYNKLSIGDAGVFTYVPQEVVFAAVNQTTFTNVMLTLAVLAIAVLFIWFFSKTISNPAKKLAAAAKEIEEGNYEIQLKPQTNDELGVLTKSFVDMGKGLAERERLKDTFGRFTNKEVAEKAARGEIAIGGERKECTIFFSDIRGFTAIRDKLSPEEVVGFLNVYMGLMVECIVQEGGTVDKFEGDAIMAIWGAPLSGEPKDLALRCVRAALRMRKSLQAFNSDRDGTAKQPIIKIGCGINSGPAIAGQIGSKQKMEYTVIGDAVNFASRTESLNKPLGTDILITENTWSLIKDEVLVEEMPSVTVKGKEGPCRMFAVVNLPKATDIPGCGDSGPKTMAEVREMLGIPTPDYAKVNLDAEEQKYNIQG